MNVKKASTKQLARKLKKNGIAASGLTRQEIQELVLGLHADKPSDPNIEKAEAIAADFVDVKGFYLDYDDRAGFSIDGQTFTIGRMGLTYLTHYFLRETIDKDFAVSCFENGEFDQFADIVNQAFAEVQFEGKRKGRREDFVLSIINDELMAVMTKYIPFTNVDVLNAVKDAGLEVKAFAVDFKEMICFLSTDWSSKNFNWLIKIENGETGLRAFRLSFAASISGYIYSMPNYSRSRHLGTIDDIIEKLHILLEEVKQLDIEESLNYRNGKWAVDQASKKIRSMAKFEDLQVEFADKETAMEVVIELVELCETRGWKGIATQWLDDIMEGAS